MSKLFKKIICAMLTLAIVVTLVPIGSIRVKARTTVASGTCGMAGNESSVEWEIDDDGVLIISGSDKMADYSQLGTCHAAGDAPWFRYRNQIKKIVINQGVTSIGNFALNKIAARWPAKAVAQFFYFF